MLCLEFNAIHIITKKYDIFYKKGLKFVFTELNIVRIYAIKKYSEKNKQLLTENGILKQSALIIISKNVNLKHILKLKTLGYTELA